MALRIALRLFSGADLREALVGRHDHISGNVELLHDAEAERHEDAERGQPGDLAVMHGPRLAHGNDRLKRPLDGAPDRHLQGVVPFAIEPQDEQAMDRDQHERECRHEESVTGQEQGDHGDEDPEPLGRGLQQEAREPGEHPDRGPAEDHPDDLPAEQDGPHPTERPFRPPQALPDCRSGG